MAAKNERGKTRKIDNPYAIYRSHDGTWEWRVLKAYQADDSKPYARWLCAVKSPFTFGSYEYGDEYCAVVLRGGVDVTKEVKVDAAIRGVKV